MANLLTLLFDGMKKLHSTLPPALVLFVIFIGFLSGCDNSIDPFQGGKASYSVYGYLGIYRDTNFVRVKDLDHPLLKKTTRMLDVKVTLANLATGRMQVLHDSLVRFDSVYTHNFYTTMNITPKTRYRLKVTSSEGKKGIAATATTPAIAETQISVGEDISILWNPVDASSFFTYSISEKPFNLESRKVFEGFCFQIRRTGIKIFPGFCPIDRGRSADFRRLIIPMKVLAMTGIVANLEDATFKFYIAYLHSSPGAFNPVTTIDSLVIPGGSGQFGGFYKDTLLITSSEYDAKTVIKKQITNLK